MEPFSARRIEQIQCRTTEVVKNLRDVSRSDRLRIIDIQPLQFRRLMADMIQVYEILNGYDDVDLECFFSVDSDTHTRGKALKYKKI